jgi:hypothetical protein
MKIKQMGRGIGMQRMVKSEIRRQNAALSKHIDSCLPYKEAV